MESNSDDVKKDGPPPPDIKPGPPPPDIKTGPPPPPAPSMIPEGPDEGGAPSTPAPGLNVKIKEDDEGSDELGEVDEQTLVGLGERVGAFLIDLLVCVVISMIMAKIIPFEFLDSIGTLVAGAYLLTRDSLPFLDGQSLGKKALRLRVETRDGKGLSENWQAGVVRNVALIVPPVWVLELVILLKREDGPEAGMRLGDDWAKTRVVKLAPPVSDDDDGETA